MKRLLISLVLVVFLAGAALGQSSTHRFEWSQPTTTCTGQPVVDGWLKEYRVFLATPTDTTMVAVVPAPHLLAENAFVDLPLTIGIPQAVRVLAVDIWDQVGCLPSNWSDNYIPIPDAPGQPSKPAVEE